MSTISLHPARYKYIFQFLCSFRALPEGQKVEARQGIKNSRESCVQVSASCRPPLDRGCTLDNDTARVRGRDGLYERDFGLPVGDSVVRRSMDSARSIDTLMLQPRVHPKEST